MKPIVAAGAIEAKILTSQTKVFCEYGKMQIGKHWVSEAEAKDKWGWLKVEEVIQKSSNVGATKIGFLFGAQKEYEWLKKLGILNQQFYIALQLAQIHSSIKVVGLMQYQEKTASFDRPVWDLALVPMHTGVNR
jgi:cell division protein FtsI/penicillin-binding protein 2